MKKIISLSLIILVCVNGYSSQDPAPMQMTLQDVLDQSLESNLDIKVERFNPSISKLEIKKARGAFDPLFSLGIHHDDNDTPLTRQYAIAAGGLSAVENRNTILSTQLGGKIPTGTEYTLDFISTRNSSTFNQFNPEYSQNLSAKLTQPLLKDFGVGSNLAFIRVSKNRYAACELKLKQSMIDLISQVESNYWDLVFAFKDLDVKKESLKLARSLLDQNRIRANLGALAPLEVVQSEAGAASREEGVISAEQKIKDETNRLKRFLFREISSYRLTQLIPLDLPAPSLQEISVTERIEKALKERTDLEQAKIELSNQNIFLKYYKNQSLPRIDLEGTLGLNGLAGGFGNGWEDLTSTDHPVWGVGVVFKYPLGNQINGAAYHQSKLQIKKALLEIKRLENDIILQIDTSASQVETFWKKIQAATLSEKFSEEALKAEQKKYETGTSTSHNVLEFEKDLTLAKSNKIKAEIDYLKALIELQRLQGITLDTHHIQIIEEE